MRPKGHLKIEDKGGDKEHSFMIDQRLSGCQHSLLQRAPTSVFGTQTAGQYVLKKPVTEFLYTEFCFEGTREYYPLKEPQGNHFEKAKSHFKA